MVLNLYKRQNTERTYFLGATRDCQFHSRLSPRCRRHSLRATGFHRHAALQFSQFRVLVSEFFDARLPRGRLCICQKMLCSFFRKNEPLAEFSVHKLQPSFRLQEFLFPSVPRSGAVPVPHYREECSIRLLKIREKYGDGEKRKTFEVSIVHPGTAHNGLTHHVAYFFGLLRRIGNIIHHILGVLCRHIGVRSAHRCGTALHRAHRRDQSSRRL